ncbi:hypothetical protein IQ07DRAFT_680065 [Pyrenochaeta sp. DS3sAY3a]|nr:hypothetical protein IQ07DRAFT_680065 [Pyrenochaeta sp. DS3sAY3a]
MFGTRPSGKPPPGRSRSGRYPQPSFPKKPKRLPSKSASSAPPPKGKKFRFLDLPAEIRVMVYEYLLIDTENVIKVEAVASRPDGCLSIRRLYRANPTPPDRDDLPGQFKGSLSKPVGSWGEYPSKKIFIILTSLLLTCRLVEEEASAVLYGQNMFVFGSMTDLFVFLSECPRRTPLLKRIGLLQWPGKDSAAVMPLRKYPPKVCKPRFDTYATFSMLARAERLEQLYLRPSSLHSLGKQAPAVAAAAFFRQASPWMRELGLRKKKAGDIIKFPLPNPNKMTTLVWANNVHGQAQFCRELAKMSPSTSQNS